MGRIITIIWCVLVFSGIHATAETIDLSLRLAESDTRLIRITYMQTMYLGTGKARIWLTRSITAEYDLTVAAVDEKRNTTVAATFRSLALSLETPAGKVDYHSGDPVDMLHPSMRDSTPLVGQDFFISITPEGRIREIQGVAPDVTKNIAMVYPDGPVKLGDSWGRKAPVSREIPIFLDSVFTLADQKEGKLFVDVRSEINQSPGSGSLSFGPFRIGYDIKGDQKGTMQFEETTGIPLRADIHQVLSAKLDIARDLELFGDFSVPLKYDGRFILETLTCK